MFLSAASNYMHQFTSKERDAETGLDYFLARYYSGAQGRFMSVDPVSAINYQQSVRSEEVRAFNQMLSNPQYWNGYAYALNNPLRYDDPTGEVIRNPAGAEEEIRKRKLEEQRRALTEFGRDLAKQVKEGKFKANDALNALFSKAQELTKGNTGDALLITTGTAFDLRVTNEGNIANQLSGSLGDDTLHHFFINAFNNFESPLVGGLATFAGNNIIGGGDPHPEDRNANSQGGAFGRHLAAAEHSRMSTRYGEILEAPRQDPLRPSSFLKPPPRE